jgi:hypothetical protein
MRRKIKEFLRQTVGVTGCLVVVYWVRAQKWINYSKPMI